MTDAKLTPIPIAQDGYEVTTADGIWIKQYCLPLAGTVIPQHAHRHDHTTMIAVGGVLVWKNGVFDREYMAPTAIFIAAGVKHLFKTIIANTLIFCIHNLHSEQMVRILAEHELTWEDAK